MSNNQDLAKISGERMDREVSELFNSVESKVKLNSSEHKYFSNLWGESDIPEVKWFTVAKRQVLNTKENSAFKDDVQDVINDILLGWTDSITELKTATLALLGRLGILIPEVVDPIVHKKIGELKEAIK